jgi:Family of unknown function (DUF6220)
MGGGRGSSPGAFRFPRGRRSVVGMSISHGGRLLQRVLAASIVAAIALQFALAGAGAFHATSFRPHTALGWAIGVAALLALAVAFLARAEVRSSALLVLAVVAQIVLALLGTHASAWFGAVHAANALVVMGAAVNLARRSATR